MSVLGWPDVFLRTAVLFSDWHVATAVQLSFIGALLVLLGLVDLIRFMHDYPVLAEEPHPLPPQMQQLLGNGQGT